ncbi:hypothetical protein Tco_0287491 [Tanacetum coccineum]
MDSQIYGNIKWIEDLVPNSMWSQTIVKYDKFALWGISHWGKMRDSAIDLQTVWESARTDDDALYMFKEGDLHRLRIQDIEDMLLLLVQGKVTNLSVEERIAFNVSLRMFTRRVVIQRRVEDLQLGVESYQKKLNLTKPDTYRSNLRRQDAYTPYSDPRGFIYENKDKKNRLMRIDELHKFSDGTLDDVRTVLNDRLKGIRMEYLPETFWSQVTRQIRSYDTGVDKRLRQEANEGSLERFCRWMTIRWAVDLRLITKDPYDLFICCFIFQKAMLNGGWSCPEQFLQCCLKGAKRYGDFAIGVAPVVKLDLMLDTPLVRCWRNPDKSLGKNTSSKCSLPLILA